MTKPQTNIREIRSPIGPEITAKSWATEAPMRMLMNNLDPDVAERPEELIVYGGIGKAARDWESFDQTVATLRQLEADETLLVQSGKPVGVFRTHAEAPRVLIANTNIVPHWATLETFTELDRLGLTMYGQMNAGGWFYIGSQGIVQGTYETYFEIARRHFDGNLSGRLYLTGGLGGMGGAQPLAATMAGASIICVEIQPSKIEFRQRTGYLDRATEDLGEALAIVEEARGKGEAVAVGLLGNAATVYWDLLERDIVPDVVTDQTSAHDPINGYCPEGWTVEQWEERRQKDPKAVSAAAKQSMGRQVRAMLEFQKRGAVVIDYGNNLRQMAHDVGVTDAFAYPGTGGALRHALPLLGEAFFALYGDSYLECDYGVVERAFLAGGCPALLTVIRNDDRWDRSNVLCVDGRIVRYSKEHRTADTRHIDYGLAVMGADVFRGYVDGNHLDLARVYEGLAIRGELAAYEVSERFYEIGTPSGLIETRQHLEHPW